MNPPRAVVTFASDEKRVPLRHSAVKQNGGSLLEHLITADAARYVPELYDKPREGFTLAEKASPADLVDAKMRTAALLEGLDAPDTQKTIDDAQRSDAQRAFLALTQDTDVDKQRLALETVDTPATVKHLVGMLTAYDWAFVEQAQQIRGYTVAGIMKETVHPDARIRLKALELLGKVTEIALFTERVEVTHKTLSDEELERELREKLGRFIGGSAVVVPDPPAIGAGEDDTLDAEILKLTTKGENHEHGHQDTAQV